MAQTGAIHHTGVIPLGTRDSAMDVFKLPIKSSADAVDARDITAAPEIHVKREDVFTFRPPTFQFVSVHIHAH